MTVENKSGDESCTCCILYILFFIIIFLYDYLSKNWKSITAAIPRLLYIAIIILIIAIICFDFYQATAKMSKFPLNLFAALFIVAIVGPLFLSGLALEADSSVSIQNQTEPPTVRGSVPLITVLTTRQTPTPLSTTIKTIRTSAQIASPTIPHKITDGFWCRDTTRNIDKVRTDIKECYKFFPDMTYQWGFSPGWPMGISQSCSIAPNGRCSYSINPKGQYEVGGGYWFLLYGDTFIDPHDPPYYTWSSTGIPWTKIDFVFQEFRVPVDFKFLIHIL